MQEERIHALVVEDEPTARRLVQEILRARGHEVEAVADAESGWAAYLRNRHALVVLDLNLPGMDGIELCRRIREVPDSDLSVIVFVTGVTDRRKLEEALEAGADDYVVKPIDAQVPVRLAIAERRVRLVRERRRITEEMARDALHDSMTGLPNRPLFLERLDQAARRSARRSGYLFSVLVVDLYDFAAVNRRHGRAVGNRVLAEVGRRLEECVRTVDTVARLQGDDFAVLLDSMKDLSDPTRVAHRIHQALSVPFRIGDEDVFTSASIGLAISLSGFERPEDVLRDAQTALMRAKAQGPGNHQMFDPVMHARAVARIQLEGKVRRALDQDELVLHYQPIVGLPSGRITGFEALVRWQDPERGLVLPDDFVPVAEETGLVVPLGWWVMRHALAQLARWRDGNGAAPGSLSVSVNVSGKQLSQPDVFDRIGDLLDEAEVDGTGLDLEITETSLMTNADTAARVLRRLKEGVVGLHIDDFGTGYSSLSYLCRFPIDTLKIDRSFVTQMSHSVENLEIVRTIIRLARNLEMRVIAEGVETEAQLQQLLELGCDAAQGFLFSRPVDAAGASALLARGSLL